jgi:hypothetical protein
MSLRDALFVDGVATERQPLLPPLHLADGHLNGDPAITLNTASTPHNASGTPPGFQIRLGACALNFYLSGVAMAAVGVCITIHIGTAEGS